MLCSGNKKSFVVPCVISLFLLKVSFMLMRCTIKFEFGGSVNEVLFTMDGGLRPVT